jgi:hypothetical protein
LCRYQSLEKRSQQDWDEVGKKLDWRPMHPFVQEQLINVAGYFRNTEWYVWTDFKRDAVKSHFPIRSKSFVINLFYKLKIKVPKYEIVMYVLSAFLLHTKFLLKFKLTQNIQLLWTLSILAWYLHILNNLQLNQCVIIMQDYTTIHEQLNKKTLILNFAVTTAEMMRENFVCKVTHYYDFIGWYLKQSSQYTQSVWNYFLSHTHTKYHLSRFNGGVFIWSDTAFRKKSDLFYFRTLAMTEQILPITCNFFAPYHGDSSCDQQHFGHVKQKLRR